MIPKQKHLPAENAEDCITESQNMDIFWSSRVSSCFSFNSWIFYPEQYHSNVTWNEHEKFYEAITVSITIPGFLKHTKLFAI